MFTIFDFPVFSANRDFQSTNLSLLDCRPNIAANAQRYVQLPTSKHFRIKLQLLLTRAETLEYALHRQLTIPHVGNWCFLISQYSIAKGNSFAVSTNIFTSFIPMPPLKILCSFIRWLILACKSIGSAFETFSTVSNPKS